MASVNFVKATSQKVGAMKCHFDMSDRLEREHANEHIDKERTEQNYFLGCPDWQGMKANWEDRLREADAAHPPKRVRADRKTAEFANIPCPKEISDAGRSDEFFQKTYALLEEKFGKENVCGMTVHKDEVHDYLDKDGTTKTSLEHGHALLVPYAHWQDKTGEREGVNAKNFETKAMLHEFNRAMNEMCLEHFGIEYNTHGLAENLTVEQLKQRTRAIEEAKQIDQMREYVDEKKMEYVRELQPLIRRQKEVQQNLGGLETDLQNTSQQLAAMQQTAQQYQQGIWQLQQEIDRLTAEKDKLPVEQLRAEVVRLEQQQADLQERIRVEESRLMTAQEVKSVKIDKPLFGDKVKVPYDELKRLKTTAKEVDSIKVQNEALKAENERLRALEPQARENAAEIIRAAKAEADNLGDRMKVATMESRLDRYERMEKAFPEQFKKMERQVERVKVAGDAEL